MERYLRSSRFFNYDSSAVENFARTCCKGLNSPKEKAVALYKAVRDGVRYNPYSFRQDPETFSASYALSLGESYCIPKAVLLGAAARQQGIPSRLGLADVTNHLSDPKFIEIMKSTIFAMHGYIELYLDNRWVKATPAFNKSLCDRFGVAPLEFDGIHDSIFHEYTGEGKKYMEYLKDYGAFSDLPHEFIMINIKNAYPHLIDNIDRGGWIQ